MQRFTRRRGRTLAAAALLTGLAAGLAGGCGGGAAPPKPSTPAGAKKFAGAGLTVACGDKAFAAELAGRCAGWAGAAGATVKVEPRPPAEVPAADVAVIDAEELGALAAKGELAPMPAALQMPGPLRWGEIAGVYRALCAWGRDAVAVPLAGDGYVLAYRADRFADDLHRRGFARRTGGRQLAPPATWEELADVAGYFAEEDKRPSLPPLPADRRRLLALFHHLAACYDRPALADRAARPGGQDTGLTFHFRPDTWDPRIDAPSFAEAADWLARTAKLRPAGGDDDPVRALDQGSAVVAVLSLAEVGRLPKDPSGEVSAKFKVAPLPGSQTYFDPAGQRAPAGRQGNYVPFLGAGAKVAVVFQRTGSAEAAWDLLAELAGPSSSAAWVSNPGLGAGPVRVDPGPDAVWLGYRFDADRTHELAEAARHYAGTSVTNPVIALRTPDQAELMAALEAEVRQAAAGKATGAEAVRRAAEAWRKHDAGRDRDTLTRWRRNAAGLP